MTWDSPDTQAESAYYMSRNGERRAGFMDYLEAKADEHPEIRYVLENGEWMDGGREPLSDEQHLRTEDNMCYYNAQTSMSPGYSYAEGYAVSGGGAIAHAWVVNEGTPIELSPMLAAMDVEYYGVIYPDYDVRSAMIDRGKAEPMVEEVV